MSSATPSLEKKFDEEDKFSSDELHHDSNSDDLKLTPNEKLAKVEQLAANLGIDQKKLMWKIDLWVVPPFCVLYFLAFLDRVNISNAKVYGLEADIGLVGNQFSTCLTVFFVPYVFFEVISNYCLKIVKPHIWMSTMIFLFGIITLCVGWVKSFGGLVACRILLGVFESGSFPGIFYVLSNFYTQREAQRRFSIFFSCTCLAGGCAGALAYRIHDLAGKHGFSSWQWIYIIEGSFTAGLGFILYFFITDFPEEAKYLTDAEKLFLKQKLAVYSGSSGFNLKQTWRDIAAVFKDPLLWVSALVYFCLIVPSYSYAFFAPTIIKLLGYTAMDAQRHSIYPWLCSLGFSIISAFASDKVGRRMPFAILACIVAIIGLSLVLAGGDRYHMKYGGCFLIASGLYTAMPLFVCWMSLNFSGHTRKGVATAFVIGFGNIGGIISSYLFPDGDSPEYKKGLGVNIGFSALAIVFIAIYFFIVYTRNQKKSDPALRAEWEKLDERTKTMRGDLNPDFIYLY
ncbi:hypothetical protein CANARDRAFT_5581 [[Candida] arabinofermentans NRRL YB-2248]|uniref:Major facilitator superfamily (MFS) profile domain-containing protein n=1 Tax=[Candida] arabinofermentans NRRL YB-2248 TaxID=983967 RepID=A0A1E4T9F4_9ASCO|nr:hypothetical protein CANARDRAFT_5581 [[Candida] arabinofermentans NRRL YB-2248]